LIEKIYIIELDRIVISQRLNTTSNSISYNLSKSSTIVI
jgi:hypothetical protein